MPFGHYTLNDGNKIPAIAFGSGSVNKGKDIHESIELALDTGFSHLDTAQYYQNEESVGEAIKESGLARAEIYLTTKWGFGDVQEAIRSSIHKLGVKQVDLYLIHLPQNARERGLEATWKEFEKIKDAGLAKSIGVSNFTVEDLQELLKFASIKPAVNQIRLHPYNISEQKSLLEFHAQHGIVTEAYGSLAPITTYPGGHVDAPLQAAAQRLGATTAQIIFAWVRAKGAVIVTTSSNKKHLEDYIAVGDLGLLTAEEVAAIDAGGANGPPRMLINFKYVLGAMLVFIFYLFYPIIIEFVNHMQTNRM